MRIQEILGHLQHAKELEATEEHVAQSNPQAFRVANKGQLSHVFDHLAEVVPLQEAVSQLRGHPAYVAPSVGIEERNHFRTLLRNLQSKAFDLTKALEQCIQLPDPHTLAIRLPKNVTSFENLKIKIDSLEAVFTKPMQRLLGPADGTPKFTGFDIGTDWLTLLYATSAGLGAIQVIVNFGAVLWKKLAESRAERDELTKQLEGTTDKGDREVIQGAIKSRDGLDDLLLKRLVGEACNKLKELGCKPENVNESRIEITVAVTTWANLLGEGATVQHALNAPKEMERAFPDPQLTEVELRQRGNLLSANNTESSSEEASDDETEDGDDGDP